MADQWKQSSIQKHLILENTTNAVIMTDENGRITVFNKKAEEFFDKKQSQVLGKHWRDIIGRENWRQETLYPTLLDQTLATGEMLCNIERPLTNNPNQFFLVDSLPLLEQNTIIGGLLIIRNITEQKEIEKQLEEKNWKLSNMVNRDGLTGVYNHNFFNQCLARDLLFARQTNTSLAVLFIDVNFFKYYNDNFGHQEGDKILATLARLIDKLVGDNGIVSRYGGDEFGVILPNVTCVQAALWARKIKSKVEAQSFRGDKNLPGEQITLSIGIAVFPDHGATREELIKRADEALYKAKKESKDRIELYFSVFSNLKNDLDTSDLELLQTTKTLISIINAKDLYTYGHSERVLEYSEKIAVKMGLSVEEVRILKLGAFIHDVGKIEINSNILNKAGPLDPDEWEMIKQHPVWGANIIKPIRSLWKVTPIIKYHHEWYNGQGYPSGLTGEQIPLLARIVTLADCFDALTSNRPYRERMTPCDAWTHIKNLAGIQFDPSITDIFFEVLKDNHLLIDTSSDTARRCSTIK